MGAATPRQPARPGCIWLTHPMSDNVDRVCWQRNRCVANTQRCGRPAPDPGWSGRGRAGIMEPRTTSGVGADDQHVGARSPSRRASVADDQGGAGLLQSVRAGRGHLAGGLEASGPVGAADRRARSGIERTGAHRLLRTLEHELLVERYGRGYRLGARNLLLGNSYLSQHALRANLASLPDGLAVPGVRQPSLVARSAHRVGQVVTLVSHLWSPLAPLDSLLAIGLTGRVERAAGGRCMLAFLAGKRGDGDGRSWRRR